MSKILRRGLIAVVFGFAACAEPPVAPPIPPRPTDIRSVSRTFLENLILHRKVSGITMRIYNTGIIRTKGIVVSSLKSQDSRVELSVPAFLIQHPRGVVLFDTGISTATAALLDRFTLRSLNKSYEFSYETQPGRDIVTQLRVDGVDPGSVRWVILSHLHFDHAGLVDQFPNATIVVSEREWGSQKEKTAVLGKNSRTLFDPAVYEKRLKLRLIDFSTTPPFGVFDHGVDLFSDGSIFLMELPGHTPGSMGAWVNLDGGPVLLAGDAAWVVDNYMDLSLPIKEGEDNLELFWRTANQLHAMQEVAPRLVIFPGHDLTPRTLSQRDDLPLMTPAFETKEKTSATILRWLKDQVGR